MDRKEAERAKEILIDEQTFDNDRTATSGLKNTNRYAADGQISDSIHFQQNPKQ